MKSLEVLVSHPASMLFERLLRKSSVELGEYQKGKVTLADTRNNISKEVHRFLFIFDTKEQKETILSTLKGGCEGYKAIPTIYESTLNHVNLLSTEDEKDNK